MNSTVNGYNIEFDGFKINVTKQGKGQPVLFLHGFPDSNQVWNKVINKVSENFTCYAIDLPGLGKSKAASRFNFRVPSMTEFTSKLIQKLNISVPLHLVVHDLGTFYGLSYSSDCPDKVKSISIFNSDFHSDYQWYFWAKVWRLPLLGEIAMFTSSYAIFKKEIQRGSKTLTDDYLRSVYQNITPYNRKMALKHFRGWNKNDLREYERRFNVNTVNIPKRVFWGERDPYTSLSYASRFGTEDIHFYPNAGHWLMVEEPEIISEKLYEFISVSA